MNEPATLILVRHAKAAEKRASQPDEDRPLTPKGRRDARAMALALKAKGPSPWLFISSPALRALQTARIFAQVFGVSFEAILIKKSLYTKNKPSAVVKIARALEDKCQTAALFGHNPQFEKAASHLTSGFKESFPKAGVAVIRFRSWDKVKRKAGMLAGFHRPKK